VTKRESAKRANRLLNKINKTTDIAGAEMILPNTSGDHVRSIKRADPVDPVDLVNKKYVDGQFPVTHASTTGQTVDDHHDKSHIHDGIDGSGTVTHANTTGQGVDDHHDKSHIHDGIDGSGTVAHSDTTGQTVDDHHDKSHSHDGVDGSGTVAHSDTTGQTVDDHHNESHTIVSHSDTSATGAELDSLTDDSMVDSLHRHSELSTTDGDAIPAMVVNASGDVHCFEDITYPDGTSGNSFYVNRKAAEGNVEYRFFVDSFKTAKNQVTGGNFIVESSTGSLFLQHVAAGDLRIFDAAGSGENRIMRQRGWITAAGAAKYAYWPSPSGKKAFT